MTEQQYLTVAEAAERMRLSKDTIMRAIHAGRLTAKHTSKRGGKTILTAEALDDWFRSLPDA